MDEEVSLFVPKTREKTMRADRTIGGALVGLAIGFSTARRYFGQSSKLNGDGELSLSAAVLDTPLDDDGPLAFWHLRDVYYGLGYSASSDDLAKFMAKKSHRRWFWRASRLFRC